MSLERKARMLSAQGRALPTPDRRARELLELREATRSALFELDRAREQVETLRQQLAAARDEQDLAGYMARVRARQKKDS